MELLRVLYAPLEFNPQHGITLLHIGLHSLIHHPSWTRDPRKREDLIFSVPLRPRAALTNLHLFTFKTETRLVTSSEWHLTASQAPHGTNTYGACALSPQSGARPEGTSTLQQQPEPGKHPGTSSTHPLRNPHPWAQTLGKKGHILRCRLGI